MSDRRRGLGRGLGALLPHAMPPAAGADQPADVAAGAAPGPIPTSGSASAPSPVDVLIPGRSALALVPDGAGAPVPPERPTGGTSAGRADHDAGAHFAEIPVDAVVPNPRQPRQILDEDAMAELVHSIRTVGLLQPVVVRPAGPGRYELVVGERRWRACREAGLTHLPAIVRETEDANLLRNALLENLHRSDLNPLEEAAAYDQLLRDFGCTQEELAARIGRSRPQVSNTLRLLRLPALVQRRVAAGVLSAGHARALGGVADAGAQERLAQRIVAEGLSVRAVEEIVALGDVAADPARRRAGARPPVAPALEDLAARLADHLETRVKVDLGRRRGKIVIEFATVDDLERIVAAMTSDAADNGAGPAAGVAPSLSG